jgi:membrane protease YdiL (CAAX protease family)
MGKNAVRGDVLPDPVGLRNGHLCHRWSTGLGGFYRQDFVTAITTSFGLGSIPPRATIGLYFVSTATIGVIRGTATVLGEERGWRGFLVPELAKRHGFVSTAAISGLIWAIWHYPIFVFATGYSAGTPVCTTFPCSRSGYRSST